MKSRLDVLLRQRELLREHAAWLDGEIALEQRAGAATATVPDSDVVAVLPPAATVSEPASVTPAALPEPDIKGLHSEVQRGCLLYFMIAAAALAALIGYVYWTY